MQPRLGFESRLPKGNVLAPLTSMVLHENHLGFLHMWVFTSFIYVYFLKNVKELGFMFFIIVIAKDCGPWPTYRGDD